MAFGNSVYLGISRYNIRFSRYNFVHTLFILVYLGTYKSDFLFLVPAASCTRLAPRLNAAHLLPGSTRHACSSNKAHQIKRKQFYSTRLGGLPPCPPLPRGLRRRRRSLRRRRRSLRGGGRGRRRLSPWCGGGSRPSPLRCRRRGG